MRISFKAICIVSLVFIVGCSDYEKENIQMEHQRQKEKIFGDGNKPALKPGEKIGNL